MDDLFNNWWVESQFQGGMARSKDPGSIPQAFKEYAKEWLNQDGSLKTERIPKQTTWKKLMKWLKRATVDPIDELEPHDFRQRSRYFAAAAADQTRNRDDGHML